MAASLETSASSSNSILTLPTGLWDVFKVYARRNVRHVAEMADFVVPSQSSSSSCPNRDKNEPITSLARSLSTRAGGIMALTSAPA